MENTTEKITWPEACEFFSNEKDGHFNICKHWDNSLCTPVGCPVRKIETLYEKLEQYTQEMKTATEDELLWYEDEIPYIEKEILKLTVNPNQDVN